MPRGHYTLYTDLMMTDQYDTKDPYRNFPPGFGTRLREVRDENALDLAEAARRIGYTRQYIGRLEAEKRGPSGTFLQRAAKVYGVNWEWLAYGRPPKRGAGGEGHGGVLPWVVHPPQSPKKRGRRGA